MSDSDAPVPEAVLRRARRLAAEADPTGMALPTDAVDLDRLCRAVVTVLGVDGAAVSLMGADGGDGVAAATGDRARELVELQFTAGEGPCLDAFELGRPVIVADVVAEGKDRWPGYLSLAADAGLGAVLVFPLHVGAARFGVLSIFHGDARSLSADELTLVVAFVRLATETLVDQLPPGRRDDVGGGLLDSLDYRAEVYQAQGMVMMSLNVTLEEALVRMRAYAFSHEVSLGDLAREILEGRQFSADEL